MQRLNDMKLLFLLGLRDITEKVMANEISSFNYDEIERIVEARFEDTQLRQSLLRSMQKHIQMK